MEDHGSATPAPACGITLAALAEQRGISKDAARRLVRTGKVQAHRVAGAHGPELCIHLEPLVSTHQGGAGDAPGTDDAGATPAPPPEVLALVTLVDRLTVENRQLAETAAVWQERARVLEERLALAPPAESPVASILTPTPAPLPQTQASPLSWVPRRWLVVLAVVAVLLVSGAAWVVYVALMMPRW